MSGVGILTAAVVAASALLQVPRHRPIPVPELATTSVLAGVAVVDRVETFRHPQSRIIYTDAHLTFEEVWKGEAGSGVRLRQYGGRLEDRAAAIPGWGYELKLGERVVVFATPFNDGTFTLKGSRQGLYRITGSQPPMATRDLYVGQPRYERPAPLEDLKREVYAALGRELPPAPRVAEPKPSGVPSNAPEGSREAPTAAAPSSPPGADVGEAGGRADWIFLVLILAGAAAVAVTLRMSRRSNREGRA